MTANTQRRLLWLEDEPYRCEYEAACIKEEGWDIVWVDTIKKAARELEDGTFDAIILDQMLPYPVGKTEETDRWGACLLLRWLRGAEPPDTAPEHYSLERYLWSNHRFREDNRDTPAILVSAFYDEQIEEATRAASAHDREIQILPKPIEIERLLAFLRSITPRTVGHE